MRLRRTYADPDLIGLLAGKPEPTAAAGPAPVVVPPGPQHSPTTPPVPLTKS